MNIEFPEELLKYCIILPKNTIVSRYVSSNNPKYNGYFFTYYHSNLNELYKKNGSFLEKCSITQDFYLVKKDITLMNLPYTGEYDIEFLIKLYRYIITNISKIKSNLHNFLQVRKLFDYITDTNQDEFLDEFIIKGIQEIFNTFGMINNLGLCNREFDNPELSYICEDVFKVINRESLFSTHRDKSTELFISNIFLALGFNGWIRFIGNYYTKSENLYNFDSKPETGDEIFINLNILDEYFERVSSVNCEDLKTDLELQYITYLDIVRKIKEIDCESKSEEIIYEQPRIKFYNSEINNFEKKYLKYKKKYLDRKLLI